MDGTDKNTGTHKCQTVISSNQQKTTIWLPYLCGVQLITLFIIMIRCRSLALNEPHDGQKLQNGRWLHAAEVQWLVPTGATMQ